MASHGFGSVLIFLALGTVLTLILQSSSATMAITLIMLSMGWIPFDMACAMVLGENIGTTITANIAASVGNYQTSVYYMDIINQYERMGDFMINISQDLERAFVKR